LIAEGQVLLAAGGEISWALDELYHTPQTLNEIEMQTVGRKVNKF